MKNNIHTIRKFGIKAVNMLVLLVMILQTAVVGFAQTSTQAVSGPNPADGNEQRMFCKRDFSNFLTIGIDFDGEGIPDYFGDIIDIPGVVESRYSANYCWYSEIYSLLKRIDKLRKQLRQAFYVCDTVTTARLTKLYFEMSAELYYIRHYADISGNRVQDKQNFRQEFIDKFVNSKGYFSFAEAQNHFEKFKAKYDAKKETFQKCKDPNLELLMAKLEELKNLGKTIDQIGKRFEQRIDRRTKLTNQRIQENSWIHAKSFGDFLNRAADFRVNGDDITDPRYWELISSGQTDSAALLESYSLGSGYTQNDALVDIGITKLRNENRNLEVDYTSDFEAKYYVGGDQYTAASVERLNSLIGILNNSFPQINKVASCTQNILNKQCPAGS